MNEVRWAAALLTVLSMACAPALPAEPPGPPRTRLAELPGAETATIAIDPKECETNQGRLRPFMVSWDATDQAEFAAQAQSTLLVVRLDGCSLSLLPTCRIPGDYRLRETAGSTQLLELKDASDLYGKATFSIASLKAGLEENRALLLRYHIRGVQFATAPFLYRDLLPMGCEEATHFVLNFSTGAFELSMSADSKSDVGAGLGSHVEVGRSTTERAQVMFSGGKLEACDESGPACIAPVRLRLLPILPGAPPAELSGKIEATMTNAKTAPPVVDEANLQELTQRALETTKPGLEVCYESYGRSADTLPRFEMHVRITVGEDGVPTGVSFDEFKGDASQDFRACVLDMMHGLRFPAHKRRVVAVPVTFAPR